MNKNFLIAVLGDNDFGYEVKNALDRLYDYGLNEDSESEYIREFIINYILGEQLRCGIKTYVLKKTTGELTPKIWTDWDSIKNTDKYIRSKLQVYFSDKRPTEDHDGGSAYLDLNLKATYTY